MDPPLLGIKDSPERAQRSHLRAFPNAPPANPTIATRDQPDLPTPGKRALTRDWKREGRRRRETGREKRRTKKRSGLDRRDLGRERKKRKKRKEFSFIFFCEKIINSLMSGF
ncbi:unnamed protein product [Musa hybrid cultivar]